MSTAATHEASGGDAAVVRLVRVVVEDRDGRAPEVVETGESLTIRVWVACAARAGIVPGVGIALVRNDGLVCYCVSTEMDGVAMEREADGTFTVALHFAQLPLLGGGYYVNVATTNNRSGVLAYDVREHVSPFRVRNRSDEFGLMRIEHTWQSGCRPADQSEFRGLTT